MTKKEFYNYLFAFTGDFDFRLKNVNCFDDPVFVNGQKWQIENKKYPAYSFGYECWTWSNFLMRGDARNQLPIEIFNKLLGTSLYSTKTGKTFGYNKLQEAEEDLAQALEKLKKPLIIQLTPTGFEIK